MSLNSSLTVEFELFEGGPLHQLLRSSRFGKFWVDSVLWRAIAIAMIAWLPLVAFTFTEGLAFSGVPMPFFHDIQAQVRFLIGLPLLIVAERYAHRILTPTLGLFLEREIVPESDRERFKSFLVSATRWNRSAAVRILLLALVLVVGHRFWLTELAIPITSWSGELKEGGLRLTSAGTCYFWVSIPIFQFVLLRWFSRLTLWGILLARVSRLQLHLVPTDPDRAGGIGFLGNNMYAFVPFLLAQGTLISGVLANRIFHGGRTLAGYWPEMVVFAGLFLVLVLGPLLVFYPRLVSTKREGKIEYGGVANRYVRDFEQKWVRGGVPGREELLGHSDIQSLVDIGNSYEIVKKMRSVPFGRETILLVVTAIALPISPLILTMFSVEEILRKFLSLIL
jgi:hypothetical protein